LNLVPVRPPGPNARKARAYAADILNLRAQGYTFEAIREALAGAGVHVSNSTVQREVARAVGERRASPDRTLSSTAAGAQGRPTVSVAMPAPAASSQDRSVAAPVRDFDCKQDAEAFFASHESNPLFTTKETS
jgi:hypothetical protein